jgi:uncharacterized membrane protein
MKALKLTAAVVAGLAAGAASAQQAPNTSGQQQQSASFELAVCNMSAFQGVFVALMHKQDAQKWVVDGWYAVPDSGCSLLGTFLRDTVYYYAESNDGASWRAADTDQSVTPQCIDHNKLFTGPAGATSCPPGEVGVKFRTIKVPANQARLTWALTGSR